MIGTCTFNIAVCNCYFQMIEQVHVPTDVETLTKQPWFTPEYQHQVDYVVSLLADLPPLSSVVITLANSILTELFTHHGRLCYV